MSSGQAMSPFSAGFDQYSDTQGSVALTRTKTGPSRVVVRWTDLPFRSSSVSYPSHLHNLPCAVDNGGGHYKLDPSVSGAIESNETWLNFTPYLRWKTVRKTFRVTARADTQSVVLHGPDIGARMVCADLDCKVGTPD